MSNGHFLQKPLSRDFKKCQKPISRGDFRGCKVGFMNRSKSMRKNEQPFSRDCIPLPPMAMWPINVHPDELDQSG